MFIRTSIILAVLVYCFCGKQEPPISQKQKIVATISTETVNALPDEHIEILHQTDTVALWLEKPMPEYKELLGKTLYWKKDLPIELQANGSNTYKYVDGGGRYSIAQFYNRYNRNFSYIATVYDYADSSLEPYMIILDIISIDWSTYKKNAAVFYDCCNFKDTMDAPSNPSNIIAIYTPDEMIKNQGSKVKPLKAWCVNTATNEFEDVTDSVECDPMPADDDYQG